MERVKAMVLNQPNNVKMIFTSNIDSGLFPLEVMRCIYPSYKYFRLTLSNKHFYITSTDYLPKFYLSLRYSQQLNPLNTKGFLKLSARTATPSCASACQLSAMLPKIAKLICIVQIFENSLILKRE